MYTKLTKPLLLALVTIISTIQCDKFVEEKSQIKILVNLLKKNVLPFLPSTSVIYQFRNDDIYWIKWLQGNSFQVNKTSNNFLKNLQWRQNEEIDTIYSEDWSYFQNEYPEFHDMVDKTGRPIIEVWFSDWNIRQVVISGKTRQLIRWLIYNVEIGMRNLFLSRMNQNATASGIIQIVDYAGVNIRTQGCISCLPIYEAIQSLIPQKYPGILEDIIMLNVGSTHNFFLTVWKNTFSQTTNISLYGRETEWRPVLTSKVNRDQLSIRFGGTKTRF